MGQVDIAINGKTYRIACEDGEEQRLSNLAAMVDAHVHDLIEQVGQIGESRLLVMASLLIADEFVDLRDSRDEAVIDDAPGDDDLALEAEERAAAALDALAERIERIEVHTWTEPPSHLPGFGWRLLLTFPWCPPF